jgi:eukaryotic-like serine/threonine-protein kinase
VPSDARGGGRHADDASDTVTSVPTTAPLVEPPRTDPSHPSPPGGTVLAARYRLLRMLGEGGMGRVYEAEDLELGERIAVKMLRRELGIDRGRLERFRQEVRLARRVTHPNVARVYDIGDDRGHRFLTMELIEGESLASVLDRWGPLDASRVIDIVRALCDGLTASHEAGVLHGDIKPHNVMLRASGRPVLMDFGVARALEVARAGGTGAAGSVAYMAPEQVSDGAMDERTDIYALGVLMWKLLTGELPFGGPTLLAIATARILNDAPDPRERVADLPEPVAKLVLRAMARRPDDRFARATELAAALEAVGGSSTPLSGLALSQARTVPSTRVVVTVRSGSTGEHAYLDRALADDIDAALRRAPRVEVVPAGLARAAFADAPESPHVAYRLAATAVLEAVVTHDGARMRVVARLIAVDDGVLLWEGTLEGTGGDVPALAVSTARQVAAALGSELPSAGRLDALDPGAVELFLRGRYAYSASYFNDDSVELLGRAHELAPHSDAVAAYYALAVIRQGSRDLRVDRIARARDLAEAIVHRDPTVGHAQLVLAIAHLADGELRSAGVSLRRAYDAAPDDGDVLDWYGRLVLDLGRVPDAIATLRRALDVEPSLVLAEGALARGYAFVGDFDAAFALLDAPSRTAQELQVRVAAGARLACWAGDRRRVERQSEVLASRDVRGARAAHPAHDPHVPLGRTRPDVHGEARRRRARAGLPPPHELHHAAHRRAARVQPTPRRVLALPRPARRSGAGRRQLARPLSAARAAARSPRVPPPARPRRPSGRAPPRGPHRVGRASQARAHDAVGATRARRTSPPTCAGGSEPTRLARPYSARRSTVSIDGRFLPCRKSSCTSLALRASDRSLWVTLPASSYQAASPQLKHSSSV